MLAPQFAGIKYRRLAGDGLQWPSPTEDHPSTCFLHKDGRFTIDAFDNISITAEYKACAVRIDRI